MQAPRDMQAQLRSLAIPADQRPASSAPRSPRTRWVVAVLLLVGLGAVGFAARDRIAPALQGLTARADKGPPVELVIVKATPPPGPAPALTATGKIVSDHTVSVATKVSGQIVELFFEQGDSVKENQVLAKIEDTLYLARRDEAAARLLRSKANLEYQKINYARVQKLLESESAPSIEFSDAKRWLDDADAAVAADTASLAFAEKTFRDCTVVAPIAGVILQRNVEVGDFVAAEGGIGANANARFAVIADMQKLRVEVDVSELDIARLRKDMPCAIVPDAYKDRRYDGRVMWLDPGANYSKATVQVKVRIEDPDAFLRVEGSAQVTFLTETPGDGSQAADGAQAPATGIWIPASAILTNPDGSTAVFTAVDGRLQTRKVSTGRRAGDRVEITAGLAPGDAIASSGVERLHEGQRVE